jgi:hypothetical protein
MFLLQVGKLSSIIYPAIIRLNKTAMSLSEIYYQPDHLWKGRKAFNLLRKESGLPLKTVKLWVAKQALWQVHLPPPKKIEYAHFNETRVNYFHDP